MPHDRPILGGRGCNVLRGVPWAIESEVQFTYLINNKSKGVPKGTLDDLFEISSLDHLQGH